MSIKHIFPLQLFIHTWSRMTGVIRASRQLASTAIGASDRKAEHYLPTAAQHHHQ